MADMTVIVSSNGRLLVSETVFPATAVLFVSFKVTVIKALSVPFESRLVLSAIKVDFAISMTGTIGACTTLIDCETAFETLLGEDLNMA
jgi:cell fate regulator YaaT (PSP1 superfamily)